MAPKDLVLQWSDHGKSLSTVFKNLREDNALVDCTLAAEGKYLQAHRLILSACSPYFEMLFKNIEGKHPIVILKDVEFGELKAVIDFVYCGEVGIPEEQLGPFLKTAGCLQVRELAGISVGEDTRKRNLVDPSDNRERRKSISPIPKKRRPAPCEEDTPAFEFVAVDNGRRTANKARPPRTHSDAAPSVPERKSVPASCDRKDFGIPTTSVSPRQNNLSAPRARLPSPAPHSTSPLDDTSAVARTLIKTEPVSDAEDELAEQAACASEGERGGARELSVMNEEYSASEAELHSRRMQGSPGLRVVDLTYVDVDGRSSTSSGACGTEQRTDSLHSEGSASPLQTVSDSSLQLQTLGTQAGTSFKGHPVAAPSRCIIPSAAISFSHKKYSCPECQKSFPKPSLLTVHRRSHAEQLFHCELCNTSFVNRGHLTIHRRSHFNDRPFSCGVCQRAFSSRGTLAMHQSTHSVCEVGEWVNG